MGVHVPSGVLGQYTGRQGQAGQPSAEIEAPRSGLMGNGPRVSLWKWGWGLQSLFTKAGCSGWERPGAGQSSDPRLGGGPQNGGRGKGDSNSPSWSGFHSQGVDHGKNSFWRRCWELAGDSLSWSDYDILGWAHRRRGVVQVSRLISAVRVQVPNSQGPPSPYSLILSGLWGAQVEQAG